MKHTGVTGYMRSDKTLFEVSLMADDGGVLHLVAEHGIVSDDVDLTTEIFSRHRVHQAMLRRYDHTSRLIPARLMVGPFSKPLWLMASRLGYEVVTSQRYLDATAWMAVNGGSDVPR